LTLLLLAGGETWSQLPVICHRGPLELLRLIALFGLAALIFSSRADSTFRQPTVEARHLIGVGVGGLIYTLVMLHLLVSCQLTCGCANDATTMGDRMPPMVPKLAEMPAKTDANWGAKSQVIYLPAGHGETGAANAQVEEHNGDVALLHSSDSAHLVQLDHLVSARHDQLFLVVLLPRDRTRGRSYDEQEPKEEPDEAEDGVDVEHVLPVGVCSPVMQNDAKGAALHSRRPVVHDFVHARRPWWASSRRPAAPAARLLLPTFSCGALSRMVTTVDGDVHPHGEADNVALADDALGVQLVHQARLSSPSSGGGEEDSFLGLLGCHDVQPTVQPPLLRGASEGCSVNGRLAKGGGAELGRCKMDYLFRNMIGSDACFVGPTALERLIVLFDPRYYYETMRSLPFSDFCDFSALDDAHLRLHRGLPSGLRAAFVARRRRRRRPPAARPAAFLADADADPQALQLGVTDFAVQHVGWSVGDASALPGRLAGGGSTTAPLRPDWAKARQRQPRLGLLVGPYDCDVPEGVGDASAQPSGIGAGLAFASARLASLNRRRRRSTVWPTIAGCRRVVALVGAACDVTGAAEPLAAAAALASAVRSRGGLLVWDLASAGAGAAGRLASIGALDAALLAPDRLLGLEEAEAEAEDEGEEDAGDWDGGSLLGVGAGGGGAADYGDGETWMGWLGGFACGLAFKLRPKRRRGGDSRDASASWSAGLGGAPADEEPRAAGQPAARPASRSSPFLYVQRSLPAACLHHGFVAALLSDLTEFSAPAASAGSCHLADECWRFPFRCGLQTKSLAMPFEYFLGHHEGGVRARADSGRAGVHRDFVGLGSAALQDCLFAFNEAVDTMARRAEIVLLSAEERIMEVGSLRELFDDAGLPNGSADRPAGGGGALPALIEYGFSQD
uniref:Exostosin domain-containing protein n=1 Tax=Macrostomum lignano TaxID=282301 RepID=A0A1I8F4I8_9PLAT